MTPFGLPLLLEGFEPLLCVPQLQVVHHHAAALLKRRTEAQLELPGKDVQGKDVYSEKAKTKKNASWFYQCIFYA